MDDKQVLEIFEDDYKKELRKYAEVGYYQGFANGLHAVLTGISTLSGKKAEPPITIEDVVYLIKGWYNNAKEELDNIKKKTGWEE